MLQTRKGFNQPRIVPAQPKETAVEVKKGVQVTEVKKEEPRKVIKPQNDIKKEIPVAVKKEKNNLREQFAFVLYACAKETTRKYKMLLRNTGLTYTQYIAMLALWDSDNINVKALGEQLYLDSGTLTPMLRKMEDAGFIVRNRNFDDERNLIVSLTEKGKNLKAEIGAVEESIRKQLPISPEEAEQLLKILGKILERF